MSLVMLLGQSKPSLPCNSIGCVGRLLSSRAGISNHMPCHACSQLSQINKTHAFGELSELTGTDMPMACMSVMSIQIDSNTDPDGGVM